LRSWRAGGATRSNGRCGPNATTKHGWRWPTTCSPASANLAKSIAIEAGELLECFQWSDDATHERVVEELADVLTYARLLAAKLGVDPDRIVLDKLEVTRSKYPVETSRGRSVKYDQLPD
jgi:dCTP diphosphatase